MQRVAARRVVTETAIEPGMFPTVRPDTGAKGAFALFVVTIILSVAGVKFGPGPLPYRSLTLVLTGAVLAATDPGSFIQAVRRCLPVLAVIATVAALGILSSLAAHSPFSFFGRQIIEIHVQAAISMVVVYALILRMGVRPVLLALIAVFTASGLLAVAQAVGFDPAWQLRALIGRIVHDQPTTQSFYIRRERALGLAFSPIHFSYQTCLAFTAVYLLRLARGRDANRTIDPVLLGFWMLMVVFSVATGNRSPLLGLFAFLPLYLMIRAPKALPVALPLILLAALLITPVLQSLASDGLRVASTEDGSAAGRATLRQFGLFLVAQRPLGYGLGFQSTEHWQDFFTLTRYLPNAQAVQHYALHNYYLNVILKYGVVIVLILPWILPRSRAQALLWLGFLPYIVHIFYHNEGPLQGDFMVFFAIPVAYWLAQLPQGLIPPPKPRRQTWRRAFAPTSV